MKSLVYLSIIYLMVFESGYAQEAKASIENSSNAIPQIIKDSIFNKGIYTSLDDFLGNNPSIKDSFIFEMEHPESKKNKNYRLYLAKDSLAKKKKIKGRVWGFSDGESVFIYNKKNRSYHQIKSFGKYFYYTDEGVVLQSTHIPVPIGGVIVPIYTGSYNVPYKLQYIIDWRRRRTLSLNDQVMTFILSENKYLLNSYKKDQGKDKKYFQYIQEFNKMYKESLIITD